MRNVIQWAMLVFVGLVAACSGALPSGPTGGSVVGVYHLRTVNGQGLPAVMAQNANGKVELTDDQYSLNADGSYSEQGHYRVTAATGAVTTTPLVDLGAYQVTNGAVKFVSTQGAGTYAGSVSNGTLTVLVSGLTDVYTQ